MKIIYKYCFFLLISVFLTNCIDEDSNLVNPPPQTKSIHIRLFNLAGNQEPISMLLEGSTQIGPVSYESCSKAVNPPADSARAVIMQAGEEKYKLNRKLRFTKDNFYTVFALPSARDAPDSVQQRDIDTLISTSTLAVQTKTEGMAFLKILNAVPKSNRTYTLRSGCPNGEALALSVAYRSFSPQKVVASDGASVSLIRTENGVSENVGLFNIDLLEFRQYLIVVADDGNGDESLYLLDELSLDDNPIIPLTKEQDLTTEIRSINLSASEVKFVKTPESILENGLIQQLPPKSIGRYVSLSACSGQSLDTLATIIANDTTGLLQTSLEVSEKYTFITFDSANSSATLPLIANPYRVKSAGNAMVRVVQAAYPYNELIVSIAARDDNPYSNSIDSLGFRSGDLISDKIAYGKISPPRAVAPGDDLPITIFTATQPADLVYNTNMSLKAGNNYLLLITYDPIENDLKIYLIEDNEESAQLQPLNKGVFAQFINLAPGMERRELVLEPVLSRAKLDYGASIATVITEGSHLLKFGNKDTIINANASDRILFVFAIKDSDIDFIPFAYPPLQTSPSFYQRRFINASEDVPMISIKENSDDTAPVVERIAYGKSSALQQITLERNLSLFFVQTAGDTTLYRVDDLPFNFGKNYTIIFGGNKKNKNFLVFVHQEY